MSISLNIYFKDPKRDVLIYPVAGYSVFRDLWLVENNQKQFEWLQGIFDHGMSILTDRIVSPELLKELENLRVYYTDRSASAISNEEVNSMIQCIDALLQKLEYVQENADIIARASLG